MKFATKKWFREREKKRFCEKKKRFREKKKLELKKHTWLVCESVETFFGISSCCHGLSLSMLRTDDMCVTYNIQMLVFALKTRSIAVRICLRCGDVLNPMTAIKRRQIKLSKYICTHTFCKRLCCEEHFWICSIWNRMWFSITSFYVVVVFFVFSCKVFFRSWKIEHIWLFWFVLSNSFGMCCVPVFEIGNNNDDNSWVAAIID